MDLVSICHEAGSVRVIGLPPLLHNRPRTDAAALGGGRPLVGSLYPREALGLDAVEVPQKVLDLAQLMHLRLAAPQVQEAATAAVACQQLSRH